MVSRRTLLVSLSFIFVFVWMGAVIHYAISIVDANTNELNDLKVGSNSAARFGTAGRARGKPRVASLSNLQPKPTAEPEDDAVVDGVGTNHGKGGQAKDSTNEDPEARKLRQQLESLKERLKGGDEGGSDEAPPVKDGEPARGGKKPVAGDDGSSDGKQSEHDDGSNDGEAAEPRHRGHGPRRGVSESPAHATTGGTVERLKKEIERQKLRADETMHRMERIERDRDDLRVQLHDCEEKEKRAETRSQKLEYERDRLLKVAKNRKTRDEHNEKYEHGNDNHGNDQDEDDTPPPPSPHKKHHTKRHRRGHAEEDEDTDKKALVRGLDGVGIQAPIVDDEYTIPLVVFAYKRPEFLRKCINNILKRMPAKGFRLFVSQDGEAHSSVTDVINSFGNAVVHLIHKRDDHGANEYEVARGWQAYYAISHHYGWAIGQVFSQRQYDRVILLEEDIEIGVDFFDYFQTLSPLLDEDDTLYCISAWNDNGRPALVHDQEMVYRSDFFPGLGWMMARSIWEELGPKWPNGFWDDWMRQPDKRKGRSCLRPEVPRTFTWCSEEGVSRGQFCREHMMDMEMAKTPVDWVKKRERHELDYLKKSAYDKWLRDIVNKAAVVPSPELVTSAQEHEVVLYYNTNEEFVMYARHFELMYDFKDNVPRTAYDGIVTFRYQGKRIHLASRTALYK